MKNKVYTGRYHAKTDEDFIVFVIGMRINKWRSVTKWWPVLNAMPPMIKELYSNKDHGFLSLETTVNFRTIKMVQYWRTLEDLLAYAHGAKHLHAWKSFNTKVGNNEAVGIFHETYAMTPEKYESLYANMPVYGLAKAIGIQPVTSNTNSAEDRMYHG
ncbi:DUF4188 domain-containing protein [Alteribacter populi]|uniref:DUF4188 domain-containing protein n=1 Tax=Alteribacter populi TaxID=2011011 RepID=UPI000BBAF515|nr:DUF4188 domain-containing protein [Alteribacter populi]